MDPVASSQVRLQAPMVGRTPAPGASAVGRTAPASQAPSSPPLQTNPTEEGGVRTVRDADGSLSRTALSGLRVKADPQGAQEISLASGEAFRWDSRGVASSDPELSPSLTRTPDGLTLLSFQDKNENTVQIQPDSMTYEVLNKKKNLAQVFHPDGFQEVVAFGQFRQPDGSKTDYQHHLVLDPQGQVVDSSGFHEMAVEGNRLSFDLGNGVRTERTLARPLPGQPPLVAADEPAASTASPAAANTPLAVLQEPSVPVGPPVTAPVEAETGAPSPFAHLSDIKSDFFAAHDRPGVAFDETPSGLIMRQEGETRAFLLPNGDSFRTDGERLEVLGETPRAKNPRLVDQGEDQFLAYSDPEGNRHRLDINTGDYEVSNRQGSVTQGFRADGTLEYAARGTYTSESGQPQQYHHRASFSQQGTLLSQEGFDDLQISGTQMKFTLPNGVETDRELVQGAPRELRIPKKLVLEEGIAQEWGGGVSLADQLLGLPGGAGGAIPGATSPSMGVPAPGADSPRTAPPVTPSGVSWRAGQSRTALPDGSGTVSVLPNGYQIVSGPEPYAIDAQGNRLAVERGLNTQESGELSHLLTVRTPEGVAYTITSGNLDTMITSADGKISQLVSSQGKVLTAITEGAGKFLHEFDPRTGMSVGPGTSFDPKTPDRLVVAGAPQGYQLPHPLLPPADGAGAGFASPGAPEGTFAPPNTYLDREAPSNDGYLAGPGAVGEGVHPSFWQRFKAAFSNENPWDPAIAAARQQDQQHIFDGPSATPPYPAGFQYTPYPGAGVGADRMQQPMSPQMEQQIRAMERQRNLMMAGTVAMTALPALSMMFFNPFGGY